MKNIISITIFIFVTIGFTACGSGGDASFKNGETIIPIDVNCTTPATIATYIPLQSGDAIVKEEDNTTVNIYHDLDGTKKVCLDSGKAHILR